MNKEWSNELKIALKDIASKEFFDQGIDELIILRNKLRDVTNLMLDNDFTLLSKCPFMNKDGYESKTMFYSYYHIARIEDICFNMLINKELDILRKNDYQKRINLKLITTGNELVKEQIVDFSSNVNIVEFKKYFNEVISTTNEGLKKLTKADLKHKFDIDDYNFLLNSNCISKDERAIWLIDYWINKDILGLIKMPFSRHLIMHIEASLRIKNELDRLERKNNG